MQLLILDVKFQFCPLLRNKQIGKTDFFLIFFLLLTNLEDYVHSDAKADYIWKELKYQKYTDQNFRK